MNQLGKSLPPLASLLPFEAAARLESFTKAAEELHLTQAAVSRQIRALEDDLSMQLFERRNRAVHLTEVGREFARVVRRGYFAGANRGSHLLHDFGVPTLSPLCHGPFERESSTGCWHLR